MGELGGRGGGAWNAFGGSGGRVHTTPGRSRCGRGEEGRREGEVPHPASLLYSTGCNELWTLSWSYGKILTMFEHFDEGQ